MPDSLQDGLLGLDYQELSGIAQKFGQPEFRARQLFDALYPQRLTALDSVSTLPKPFRAALQQEGLDIKHPRVEKSFQSTDGTIRYLIAMVDGETVETVWMPEGDEGEAGDGSVLRQDRRQLGAVDGQGQLAFGFSRVGAGGLGLAAGGCEIAS